MRQGRQGGQGRQGRKFNHAIPQNKVVRLLVGEGLRGGIESRFIKAEIATS